MEIPINMHLLFFVVVCVLFTTTECATSIQNCPRGSVDVVKDTAGILTCEGYSTPEITWEYKSGLSAFSTVGRCTSTTCTLEPPYNVIFNLMAKTGTSSELGLTTRFTAGLKNATFSCDGVECVVNIVAEEGLSGGQIAGIVIGVIVGVGVIIGVGIFIARKYCKDCSKKIRQPSSRELDRSPEGVSLSSQPHA